MSGPSCWATRLDERAKAYVDETKRLRDNGEQLTLPEIAETLRNVFDVDVVVGTITAHYRGLCRCGR